LYVGLTVEIIDKTILSIFRFHAFQKYLGVKRVLKKKQKE